MLKNYLKLAYRNLVRQKLYSILCIVGLAFGIACSLILYLFVQDELGFDRFYDNPDEVFTIQIHLKDNEGEAKFVSSPGALAAALEKDYPEIKEAVRVRQGWNGLLKYKNKKIELEEFIFSEDGFFDILTYDFICGSAEGALKSPNTLVLPKSTATKIFGSACQAINQTVELEGENFLIKGVIEDIPLNSSIQFEALASISSIPYDRRKDMGMEGWVGIGCQTLVRTNSQAKYQDLNVKMKSIQSRYFAKQAEELGYDITMKLYPISHMRLYGTESSGEGSIIYIYILSLIAVFILLIAIINYINLATARSITRAREVGVRKVLGSHPWQLRGQFIVESLLIVLLAFFLGVFIAETSLPFFNQLAEKELRLLGLINLQNTLLTAGFLILVTLLSGLYPAFVLSRFEPVKVLKGKFSNTGKGNGLRQALVTFQFTVSVILMIATGIVYQQLNYVKNKDLGFNKDQIVVLSLSSEEVQNKGEVLRKSVESYAGVESAVLSNIVPNYNSWANNPWKGRNEAGEEQIVSSNIAPVGFGFNQALDIKIIAGRDFSPQIRQDSFTSVIINEKFAELMAWENPVGKEIYSALSKNPTRSKVVGVVENFHLFSLKQEISPLIMQVTGASRRPSNLILKLQEGNIATTLGLLKNTWEKFEKNYPFNPVFLDQSFARMYRAEQIQGLIFLIFSGLTILIACLGLFGLATFTVQSRNKEIGIRKVLGARVSQIVTLLSTKFLRLVLIASLISLPIAYYLGEIWLESFVYRISLAGNWYIFLLGAFLAGFMSLLTIGLQTLRAAQTNPMEVLRDE